MYEGHFQLRRRPFAATPDPICHYVPPSQAPLLQSVARCIDLGQGIAIATGPAGIGKTLLAQVLLAESESRFAGVYLGTGQFPTRRALLQAILYELGQSYGGMTDQELRLELNTALRNLITLKDGLLLVLDEAHLLSDRLLEEVRFLADLAQYGIPLTRVVLSGNPEFEERLTSPALAAFNQRVACHIVLEQFTRAESVDYLRYRIQWAGGEVDQIFEPAALELIAAASDGVPRCLSQLAERSLTQAYLAGQTTVGVDLVRQTLAELQHLPLRWNASVLQDRSRKSPAERADITSIDREGRISAGLADERHTDPEDSTCCFEFGAGDGELELPQTESVPATEVPTIAMPEAATYSIAGPDLSADSEDQDGPPLFAWLAKSEDLPSAASQSADADFSTSSFTIRARRRERPQPIEQEIVSTELSSGPKLPTSSRSEVIRGVSTGRRKAMVPETDLPAEEVVVDQYAALDARQAPTFPRAPAGFPQPELASFPFGTVREADPVAGTETFAGERDSAADRDHMQIESASNPLERIDALCELLDQADSSITCNGGVELITEYGVERIDVDLPSNSSISVDSQPETTPASGVEEWIGSTVVEIGRDLQQAMEETSPRMVDRARAARIDHLLNSIEREVQFDIVEPDPVEAVYPHHIDSRSTLDDATGDQARVVPPPNHSYKNFFSVLRRRQAR